MKRPALAPLARSSGLALLLAHAAAHAQHAHGEAAAVSAPSACACPAAAAVAMPHAAMGPAAIAHATSHPHAAAPLPAADTPHAGMDHAAMGHADMDHAAMSHAAAAQPQADHPAPAQAGMPAAAAPPAAACACAGAAAGLPREPIRPITAADRAAAFPVLHDHGMAHGASRTGYLLVDRLEAWDNDHGSGHAWELHGWYGGDIDRLWLRSAGERDRARTVAADLELAYGRAISPWWDVLVGAKQELTPGRRRTSAGFGVQGLAPYKFEVSAMLYVGAGGHASMHLEGEYAVLLTNRLILQPRLEAELAWREDRAHRVASGLATLEGGLRLRYEVTRRFAPYLGVVHARSLGGTAEARRDAGEAVRETRWVAGLRVWF